MLSTVLQTESSSSMNKIGIASPVMWSSFMSGSNNLANKHRGTFWLKRGDPFHYKHRPLIIHHIHSATAWTLGQSPLRQFLCCGIRKATAVAFLFNYYPSTNLQNRREIFPSLESHPCTKRPISQLGFVFFFLSILLLQASCTNWPSLSQRRLMRCVVLCRWSTAAFHILPSELKRSSDTLELPVLWLPGVISIATLAFAFVFQVSDRT